MAVPVMMDFSVQTFFDNALIVSRGLLIIFLLFFSLQDIESNKVYNKVQKYLPEELIYIIKIAFRIMPIIKDKLLYELSLLKKRWYNPLELLSSILETFVLTAEELTNDLEKEKSPAIIFITGKIHEGKTTLATRILSELTAKNKKCGGILAPGFFEDGKRSGFDVINVSNGERIQLAATKREQLNGNVAEKFGPYYFSESGLSYAQEVLKIENLLHCDAVFVDEVGRLEILQKGYYNQLKALLHSSIPVLYLVVRDNFIDEVKHTFGIKPLKIITVGDDDDYFSETSKETLISSTSA
jgi:nucleoside-triphosphatase